ncbi:tetratricopeptide repeat protein [Ramlibacter sp. PS3R-8]|uniref:tetratricopeptide repeat protein n=1 Tax=Ramlibacter sp. PS3R-8 TaxID=3133437 RepID=UPI00309C784A
MEPTPASRANRLRQLQGYLAQDPANAHLLAEVCDAALSAGEHEAALQAIEAAEAHHLEPAAWLHRRAHVAMARCQWDEALAVLARVQAAAGNHAALLHDIALVHLCAGQHAACRDVVATALAEPAIEPDMLGRLQALWLRAMHHLGLLSEAWQWVEQQQASRRLQCRAMGVAALLAIDLERFPAATALAEAALADPQPTAEAFVAAAYVALARRQTDQAAGLLQRALQANPRDGRTWSALGLANLQSGDIAGARQHLERAIHTLPGHIGTWHALGWACLLLQDLAAARPAFERALALDRNFGESHAAMALVLLLEGRAAESGHYLRVAERLDSRSVTAGYVRALGSDALGDARSIRALADRLLDRPGFFGGRLSDSLPPSPD